MLLPFTLISFIISFAATTGAVPVDAESPSLQLTSDSFTATTSSGTWLIEFFSPFCGHCRHFAPTWFKVEEEVNKQRDAGGELKGIRTAQVNCITDGDVCNSETVKGYPTLRIYKEGAKGPDYDGDRQLDLILKFLSSHAPAPQPTTTSESLPTTTTSTPATQTVEEPPSFHIQTSRSNPNINPDGRVLQLNPANFLGNVAGADPVFIKFFAPWCGHCKKLAPVWTQLAERLKQKMTVAEVNCETHSKLCTQEGVEGFPMLYLYRGGTKLDYTGARTLEAMEQFSEAALQPTVIKLDPSISTPSSILASSTDPVTFVFIHLTVDRRPLSLINEIGNELLTNPPIKIYTTTSPSLRGQFGQTDPGPALFVLKKTSNSNSEKPHASLVLHSRTSKEEIIRWIEANRFPPVSELTGDNFQSIMPSAKSANKPLVVIWPTKDSNKDAARKILEEAEEKFRLEGKEGERKVLWVYMDVGKWGTWLGKMYGVKKDSLPSFVIADHAKLRYYSSHKSGTPFSPTVAGLVLAAQEASTAQLIPKHSRNIFERTAQSVSSYLEAFVDLFVQYPIRMVLLMACCLIGIVWFLTKYVGEDIGGRSRSPTGNGNGNGHYPSKLRLAGNKLD